MVEPWGRRRPLGALFRRLFSRRDLLLSVIVPFRDVERYLEECLRSILAQEVDGLELILVDDGSVDSSAAIAQRIAREHRRTTILTTSGQGAGVARNAGVAAAHGQYLAFVDSDDVLPPGALKLLLESARRNDADIVVGPLRRFNSTRRWDPRWLREVHSVARDATTVAEFPALLRNNYPCGKVFRRDFWMQEGLAFEPVMIFEDQPLIAQLMWRADRINVVDKVCYDYRARDDRSSVSQRPEELRDLQGRIEAWRRTLLALRADAQPEAVVEGWYRTLYTTHFHWYLRSESVTDPQYWSALREIYQELAAHCDADMLSSLHPSQRVPLLLLASDQPRLLAALNESGGLGPAHLQSDGVFRVDSMNLPVTFPDYDGDPYTAQLRQLTVSALIVRARWSESPDGLGLDLDLGLRCEAQLPPTSGRLVVTDGHGVHLAEFGLSYEQVELRSGLRTVSGIRCLAHCRIPLHLLAENEALLWAEYADELTVPVTTLLTIGGAAELVPADSGNALLRRLRLGRNRRAPVRLTKGTAMVRLDSVELSDRKLKVAVGEQLPSEVNVPARPGSRSTNRASVSWDRGGRAKLSFTAPGGSDLPPAKWIVRLDQHPVFMGTNSGRPLPGGWLAANGLVATVTGTEGLCIHDCPTGAFLAQGVVNGRLAGVFVDSDVETDAAVDWDQIDWEAQRVRGLGADPSVPAVLLVAGSLWGTLPVELPDGSLLVRTSQHSIAVASATADAQPSGD